MSASESFENAALRILSLGGGTQSCALALMSAAGDLPKLDHIVFADTQGEVPETYEYIEYLRGVVEAAGIPLHVVTGGSLELSMLGAIRTPGNPSPPAHIEREDGKKGRLNGYKCSYDFKRLMIERKIKSLCGPPGAWKRSTVEQWIGFSEDEAGRCKPSNECRCGHARVAGRGSKAEVIHEPDGCTRCACSRFDPWMRNVWPLMEMRMRRSDTIAWFAANGHPTPPRSACWFCPNSGNERWRSLRATHPDLWERACALDDGIRHVSDFRNRDNTALAVGSKLYLHASLTPLRVADLRSDHERTVDAGQGALFDPDALSMDCNSGVCFT